MKRVFIVMSGEYSDYSVEGVFTTREKAEAFIELHKRLDAEQYGDKLGARYNWGVRRWRIDKPLDEVIKEQWSCSIDGKTGNITWEDDGLERVRSSRVAKRGGSSVYEVPESDEFRCRGYSFVSAEHARKIAAEARQRMLAKRALATTTTTKEDAI